MKVSKLLGILGVTILIGGRIGFPEGNTRAIAYMAGFASAALSMWLAPRAGLRWDSMRPFAMYFAVAAFRYGVLPLWPGHPLVLESLVAASSIGAVVWLLRNAVQAPAVPGSSASQSAAADEGYSEAGCARILLDALAAERTR